MVFKKIIFQNRYVALETPPRPPPLHGKYHLKFPFWLFAHLPNLKYKYYPCMITNANANENIVFVPDIRTFLLGKCMCCKVRTSIRWHDNRFEVKWRPKPTLVLRWISKFFLFGALPIDTLKIKHTKNLKETPSRDALENLPEKACMNAFIHLKLISNVQGFN